MQESRPLCRPTQLDRGAAEQRQETDIEPRDVGKHVFSVRWRKPFARQRKPPEIVSGKPCRIGRLYGNGFSRVFRAASHPLCRFPIPLLPEEHSLFLPPRSSPSPPAANRAPNIGPLIICRQAACLDGRPLERSRTSGGRHGRTRSARCIRLCSRCWRHRRHAVPTLRGRG